MSDFWEEWRRNLRADHPDEVKQEYRIGPWRHDFYRERPTRIGRNTLDYPSQEYDGPPLYDGRYWNKAFLLERGWTRTAIKRILGEPDQRVQRVGLPKDRPECLYLVQRVEQAEAAGAIRFRRPPQRKAPIDYWEDGYVPEDWGLGVKEARRMQLRKCIADRAWRRRKAREERAEAKRKLNPAPSSDSGL